MEAELVSEGSTATDDGADRDWAALFVGTFIADILEGGRHGIFVTDPPEVGATRVFAVEVPAGVSIGTFAADAPADGGLRVGAADAPEDGGAGTFVSGVAAEERR